MRMTYRGLGFAAACLALFAGCSSTPLGDDESAGGAATDGTSGSGTGGSASATPRPCSGALRQSLSLVDEVSTAAVKTLSEAGDERIVYVDASVGGIDGQDTHPWVYLSLATGQAVAVTDLEAFDSMAWDLALKRSTLRTNSGDSGPGKGGAIRVALAWDKVAASTLGNLPLPIEEWFDEECSIVKDATNNLVTTFSDWSEYDEATHVLAPADAVYITAGADGALYKLQILDYYSTATGTHGAATNSGHYKLRIAPLL
jgi:HmuY protein